MEWYKTQVNIGDRHAARIKRAFLNRTLDTRSATDWEEVARSIPAGEHATYNSIIWAKWLPGEQVKPAYGEMYERSKVYLHKYEVEKASSLYNYDPNLFRMPNPAAELWLTTWSAQEVRNISEQDLKLIREVLRVGQRDGSTYKQTARQLEDVLGLNERQYIAYDSYVSNLKTNKVKEAQVERLADKYYNKLLKYRAETVALTESHTATNRAWTDSVSDAVRKGVLNDQQYQLKWLLTPDDRLCPRCQAKSGDTAPLTDPVFEGDTPPLHPRCRCTTVVERK